jgi:pilus assembly protein CpaB
LVLVVALVLAGVAAFAIFQYLSGIEASLRADQEEVLVFRARQAIPEGQDGNLVLQSFDVFIEESREQTVDLPEGAITTRDELEAVLRNKVAVGPIARNQILTNNMWVELTVDITPLSELIPEGKQALTFSTDAVRGVNGFIRPGDRLNVIVTLDIEFDLLPTEAPDFGIPTDEQTTEEAPEEQSETVTLTRFVLQGLPVMAVGQDVRPQEGENESVSAAQAQPQGEGAEGEAAPQVNTTFTLELTPEQAERLVFAQENGSIYLTLVPPDFVPVDTRGITIETLFEGDLVEDIFGS